MMQKITNEEVDDKRLTNFRTSSVRTSYSIDSSNSIINSKNTDSFGCGNDNFKLQANYSLKPAPHYL